MARRGSRKTSPLTVSPWESTESDSIRKKCGIRCKQVKKFKATTDSTHTFPVAENLLAQKFKASGPNQVWTSDITYIPTDEGWLYCAAHKDLFNGGIAGYALGPRMTKKLVARSLIRAVTAKHPPKGLIHHSDRGSQYCSPELPEAPYPLRHRSFHEQEG